METTAASSATNGGAGRSRRAGPLLRRLLWLLPVPAIGFLLFGSTGRDDSYITYWVADQLRRTGKITNYNGRALEQSSSLLHVLVLAGASVVTRLPVTTIGPWLAIAFGAACTPVAAQLSGRLEPSGRWVAAALVATLPPLVYWSFGGLETSLACLLVLLALLAIARVAEGATTSRLGMVAVLLAVVLVRPETGIVFFLALVAATPAVGLLVPRSWRGVDDCDRTGAARRVLAAAIATAGWLIVVALFRKTHFDAWVPRPVSVKTGTIRFGEGYHYVVNTLVRSRTLVAVGAGVVVLLVRRRALTPAWIVAGAVVATGVVTVMEPGGDWMEGGRLLAPWLTVAVVLVGASLGRLAPSPRVLLASFLIVLNGAGLLTYAERYSTGIAAWSHFDVTGADARGASTRHPVSPGFFERRNAVHVRDLFFLRGAMPVFAALERTMAPRRVTYASSQAGMVVYYLQQDAVRHHRPFHFIDQYGLTDDSWDRCRDHLPSSDAGKRVSWQRVLSGRCGRLPDIISGRGIDPAFGLSGLDNDYTAFVQEEGNIESADWPRSAAINARQWLAVRNDLVPGVRAELARERRGR